MRTERSWIIRDDRVDRNAMTWAVAAAVGVHLLFLLLVRFPDAAQTLPRPIKPTDPPRIIRPDLPPPPMPEAAPIEHVIRQPAIPVPFPAPPPPEPIFEGAVIDFETPVEPMTVQIGEPAPPDTPSGPRRLWADANLRPPELILDSKIAPIYPELARQARRSGRVIVEAVILEDGSVGEIEVLLCDHPGLGFEQAAIEAISRWLYQPARLHGKPVAVYFTVRVEFELQ